MTWVRAFLLATAGTLIAYGASLNEQRESKEISSARAAVREATTALGEDHPVTAFMIRNLALAFEQAGYHNYAEHYASQALSILQARFGPHDVSLVPALNVMAEAYVSEGRYTEAREFAMRAVAIGPEAGAHYATALHTLGAVFQGEGQYDKALVYFRRALAERESTLPPGHPFIKVSKMALQGCERAAKLNARR
jgi:tetratricopeptide (TPR) repeat protein